MIFSIFGFKDVFKKKAYLLPLKCYHSQFGQDDFVYNILNKKRPGYFVDVGARDGKVISNTLFLEKNKWKGISIEPHPDLFNQLEKNRESVLINCAISNQNNKKLKFVKYLEEPLGNSGLLNTYRDKRFLKNIKHDIIDIKAYSLDYILRLHSAPKYIDYLDIDVEGHELECIKSINFKKYTFNAIGIETQPGTNANDKIVSYLKNVGYKPFAVIGSDIFFNLE